MNNFNDNQDIELFSHLIETILHWRLSSDINIYKKISKAIDKLESLTQENRYNLNIGIQMLSKLNKNSAYNVEEMLEKHFSNHFGDKYQIYLEIYQLANKNQQQITSYKINKNKVLEKWVFNKQSINNRSKVKFFQQFVSTDLIIKVLRSLNQHTNQKNQESNKIEQLIINNTTAHKGYQLVIKSKCKKNMKNTILILHHEKQNGEPCMHLKHRKLSLLQFYKYWEKSIQLKNQFNIRVGCYFVQENYHQHNVKNDIKNNQYLEECNRKLSAQTKAQQKSKDSISSSSKLSFQNFPFKLNFKDQNKKAKQSQSFQKIQEFRQRPRYQSIYESKDEEMNIFILSPRKLSQEQSPKIKNFQQKTIQFQINDESYGVGGISQELIQEFILEPDQDLQEKKSNSDSSDGFQLLEDNDQLDSIRQERSKKLLEEESFRKKEFEKQKQKLNLLDLQLIKILKSMEKVVVNYI